MKKSLILSLKSIFEVNRPDRNAFDALYLRTYYRYELQILT